MTNKTFSENPPSYQIALNMPIPTSKCGDYRTVHIECCEQNLEENELPSAREMCPVYRGELPPQYSEYISRTGLLSSGDDNYANKLELSNEALQLDVKTLPSYNDVMRICSEDRISTTDSGVSSLSLDKR